MPDKSCQLAKECCDKGKSEKVIELKILIGKHDFVPQSKKPQKLSDLDFIPNNISDKVILSHKQLAYLSRLLRYRRSTKVWKTSQVARIYSYFEEP